MESLSQANHGPGSYTINLLFKHVLTTLLEALRFSTLALVISLEAIFVLQKWKPIFHFLLLSIFIFIFTIKPYFLSSTPVYLVDFSCFKPPDFCKAPFSLFLENASKIESFDKESVAFMAKILTSSGLGEETYLPPALHCIPPKPHQQESIKEAEMVLPPIMEDLLSKTKISPRDIDILIVNCSGFCPSPSLSAIISNKFSMRDDVKSFSLSGMGCSAGAIAIDMAQNLLKVHKNSYAVVLSTEILSTGWYPGHEKSKLLLNCTFRMGGAAILLSNKNEAKKSSKYNLFFSFVKKILKGKLGVTIHRDFIQIFGETLKSNLTILGEQILPTLEKFWHAVSIIRMRFFNRSEEIYVPNFKSVIQHFCLPTSGSPVIREMAKGLKLGEKEVEAAFMTLRRFGNQSSSSLWYELAYLEAKEMVKKGDKVWLLGIGTGPKCCSLVWECLRPIVGESNTGPWAGSIN
ncbi:3-KETOACYL-COA SYNTHASE [Salix koriyanagi]|uniref:3-ketoacyl-CoA synthase n=1 Tax=Salix koriyanagi TaxID=2511006 RepID=A0A9Q0PI65_9ROSI|nr:3-KETOACYL-COA SYNTHASE [Salix koriyanagi]